MPDSDRLLLENEFRIPVYSSYQAAETLRLGFQCERREGFHISLDHVAVRVVDKEGRPVGPGKTGEIVISNLTNHATVLLNYKLGDMVTLGSAPCPCGRILPTIARIEGRSDDLIALPGGEFIHSLVVLPALHRIPGIIQVKLIQEDLQSFSLQVVCVGAVDWRRTHQALDTTLRSILNHVSTVNIVRLDSIKPEPGDKIKAVVSLCVP